MFSPISSEARRCKRRLLSIAATCALPLGGCLHEDVEFQYHLVASGPEPVAQRMIPCSPCITLSMFTDTGGFQTVRAARDAALVVRQSDIERVEILEWAPPGRPEDRFFVVTLEPKPAARQRIMAFKKKYMFAAAIVTTDGARGSPAPVSPREDIRGGAFASKGEAEEVARAVGVPTRFVGFNEAAHRRFSEGWDPE